MENAVSIPVNAALSFSGDTAPLIVSMPNINMAKPSRTVPSVFFFVPSFPVMRKMMPIAASTGEKELGLSSLTHTFPLSIPARERIHEVIVVPILAPMITPTACVSFIMPELTKPTTMTVVADEDWIVAVTKAPSSNAFILFSVSFSKTFSSFPPESITRPSPMVFIPYKNRASPPIIVSTPKISIFASLLFDESFLIIGIIQ